MENGLVFKLAKVISTSYIMVCTYFFTWLQTLFFYKTNFQKSLLVALEAMKKSLHITTLQKTLVSIIYQDVKQKWGNFSQNEMLQCYRKLLALPNWMEIMKEITVQP